MRADEIVCFLQSILRARLVNRMVLFDKKLCKYF